MLDELGDFYRDDYTNTARLENEYLAMENRTNYSKTNARPGRQLYRNDTESILQLGSSKRTHAVGGCEYDRANCADSEMIGSRGLD